jgi:chromosome segregation ATPase
VCKLQQDVESREEALAGLRGTAAAGSGDEAAHTVLAEKDKEIAELQAKLKKVMTDAKRIFEKYKSEGEEVKQREAALQAQIDQLKQGGAGREEMEMQVAALKRDLAQTAEDLDATRTKLQQFKRAAEEKIKSDRAKYLAHLEQLKQSSAGAADDAGAASMESVEESVLGGGEEEEDSSPGHEDGGADGADADFETPEVLNKVAASMGSMLKGLW